MNKVLFKKLNETLSNPIKKASITISEDDEMNFIFGKNRITLPELLAEDYNFDRDEYIAYIRAANDIQKKFDDKRYKTKKEIDKEEKERKKEENKQKKEDSKLSREIERLKKELSDSQNEVKNLKMNSTLEIRKEAEEAYNQEYKRLDNSSVLSNAVDDIYIAIKNNDKTIARNALGVISGFELMLRELNRDSRYSVLPSSVKKERFSEVRDSIIDKARRLIA